MNINIIVALGVLSNRILCSEFATRSLKQVNTHTHTSVVEPFDKVLLDDVLGRAKDNYTSAIDLRIFVAARVPQSKLIADDGCTC